jgi:glycosyltransferase involved in cell wall biosynthesis
MGKPRISIVIPTHNEEDYILECLDSLVDQFVIQNAEIIVADGMSQDQTRDLIRQYQHDHPRVRMNLIDNPAKHQSYGTNLAIKNSHGEIIAWAGAHSIYPKNYVKRCVDLLEKTGADNVGGAIYPKWKNRFQHLVATAVSHPFGVGNARFRLGNFNGYVDTVFPGTFRKSTFEKIGGFDPYTNQDAEFNLRILKSGGKIYMDSSIRIGYFPKDSLPALIRQYFNYGRGRCRTTLKHKKFTSLRQIVPTLLVSGLAGSLVIGIIFNPIFLFFPAAYLASDIGVSFLALKENSLPFKDVITLAAIFASMHIFWGLGFIGYLVGFRR